MEEAVTVHVRQGPQLLRMLFYVASYGMVITRC